MAGLESKSQGREPAMWIIGGLTAAVLVAAAVLVGGYATGWGGQMKITQAAVPVSSTTGTANATLNLTIVTGEMMGKGAQGPAYVPSSFTIPAYSTVKVTVTDFDGTAPLTGKLVKYSKVTGTVGGTMQVQPINVQSPNTTTGPVKTMNYLAPDLVAHTLTIPALGLNVPMAAQSRITFEIKTGKPGVYQWQCMAPCGDGPQGMQAPMFEPGFMAGSMTVAG